MGRWWLPITSPVLRAPRRLQCTAVRRPFTETVGGEGGTNSDWERRRQRLLSKRDNVTRDEDNKDSAGATGRREPQQHVSAEEGSDEAYDWAENEDADGTGGRTGGGWSWG